MFKTHVVDCREILAVLHTKVPQHLTHSQLNQTIVNRTCKRLLKQAIFDSLPHQCIVDELNMMDYPLLSAMDTEILDNLLQDTSDRLKSLFYHKSIDISNYTHIECKFDGVYLYIKVGVEKCTTKHTPSTFLD